MIGFRRARFTGLEMVEDWGIDECGTRKLFVLRAWNPQCPLRIFLLAPLGRGDDVHASTVEQNMAPSGALAPAV